MKYVIMRIFHVLDAIKLNGFKHIMHETIYFERKAIPVEKDLSIQTIKKPLSEKKNYSKFTRLVINNDILKNANFIYCSKNRQYKAEYYLGKGFLGYGIAEGSKIVGDVWYYNPMLSCEGSSHPDLQWLGINLEKNQVYSFDLFLDPQKRGDNAAAYLQSSFLEHLKEKGIRKVYGYFWSDNIPALWVHRQLKYRELNSVTVNRFFFIKHRCS